MKILASGLAAAVLLCANTTQAAAPPSVPEVASGQDQPAEVTAIQEWAASVNEWTLGYDALTTQSIETLAWFLDGAVTLAAKLQSGGPAVATPWAQTWAAEARARLAADMAAYTQLSPHAPPLPAGLPIPPPLQAQAEALGQMSDQIGTMMLSLNHSADRFIVIMEEAAAGKDRDLTSLEDGRMGLMIAQMDAEIVMLRSSSAGLTGPSLHFARAQIATNRALKVWLERNRLKFTGRPTDDAAAASAARVHVAEIRSEVAAMHTTIADARRQIRNAPGLADAPFGILLARVLVTMEASAEVEAKLADALDDLSAALVSGDDEADNRAGVAIERLTNERIAIDTARRQLIAESGS